MTFSSSHDEETFTKLPALITDISKFRLDVVHRSGMDYGVIMWVLGVIKRGTR